MTADRPMQGAAVPDAVLRLSIGGAQGEFLAPHHLEAATRLSRLFERAGLRQRVTMSYDPGRVGRSGSATQADLADSAAAARQRLATLAGRVPTDCWGVLTDVCVYDKGLQSIEAERNWPRRSAKLVLRIGLEQVANQMGLGEKARGKDRGTLRQWLPERVPMA